MEKITVYNDKFENDATSVDNNSIMATTADNSVNSDDFDRLLDEFIRKSLEEDTENKSSGDECEEWEDDEEEDGKDEKEDDEEDSDSKTGFLELEYGSIDYELGGTVYRLPVKSSPCKASKLVLHNGYYEEQVLTGEPIVFVSDEHECSRLTLVAHSVLEFKPSHSPMVYIYKASESYPVKRVAMLYDEYENYITATCEEALDALPCGNYFFYILGVEVDGLSHVYKSCKGGFCIPFVKVSGDIELPPVALQAAGVKAVGRNCTLDVSLKFDKMLDIRYAYSLFLYNRNCNLVSRGATFAWDSYSTRKRKNLSARLATTYIPFGEYRLFVLQNGVPRWKVEFSVDAGKAAVAGISEVKPFDEEYIVLYELEKDSNWHRFREGHATVEMKKFFLSTCKHTSLSKRRISMGLSALVTPQHFVYNGGNSVAELGALGSMSRMFWNVSYFDPVDCITLIESTNVSTPNDRITEQFSSCNNKCIALYNISALAGNGPFVVKKMIDAMNRHSSFYVCLIGSRAEIGQLFDSFPQLKRYFPDANSISSVNILAETFVDRVMKELQKLDLRLSIHAQQFLVDTLQCAEKNGCLHGLKMADIYDFVKSGIVDNFISRVMSSADKKSIENKAYLSTVEACDVDAEKILWNRENGFEESIKQLNMMVGLNNVKQNIITTFNRLKISAERRRLGLKVKGGECHHMLFTGNPGTGKTTVAKMMGRIYHSLGLLSKGDVVFVDRSRVVGRYIGDTENNMQRILQEAKGNILFIDEAYTLCDGAGGDRKDFGYRAIECLLTVMAQDDCDMIVIFAGYSKEIEAMMRCNQGLSGRFPYKFDFADYTADELMQIAEQKLSQEDYELTTEAREVLYKTIEETVINKDWDFCNARWVGQYVNNGIIPAQCERLMQRNAPISRDDYRLINAEDVSAAYALQKPMKKNCKIYRGIGFTA